MSAGAQAASQSAQTPILAAFDAIEPVPLLMSKFQAASRRRRLIRVSIADIPRKRSGLISAASPSSA